MTWQQTKSHLTRVSILNAAVECLYEQGYTNTTTDNISKRAGVSRGAMLHHFPSKADLMRATVEHLNRQRIEMFATAETEVNRGAEYSRVEEGIDAYWAQLKTPEFIVFHELKVAARTDPELAQTIGPAMKAFETAWYEAVVDLFPDLARSESFARANFLTKLLLEGMALARFTEETPVPEEKMLRWLKQEVRESFADVLGSVKRPQGGGV